MITGKTKKAVGTSKETYENPAFNKDAETNVKPHNGDANKAGRGIFKIDNSFLEYPVNS